MAARVPKKSTKKKPAAKVVKKKRSAPKAKSKTSASKVAPRRSALATRPPAGSVAKARAVKQYDHPTKKRLNNPPVGLVTPDTDPDLSPKTYAYDPHLDPQLVWTGTEEKKTLTVDTVSLHVHERIDPYTIMEAVRNKESYVEQTSLFEKPAENPPLREAVDFYKHQHGWSNRLIAGDSVLVMNSLLEREAMAGQVQMIYMDPPYGIKYGSNFQPFTNKRNPKDGDDADLTTEPEMIHAFRDTWELGVHSYLTNVRDRIRLARDLMSDSGSFFMQISDQNLDLVGALCGEIFGRENHVATIAFRTNSPLGAKLLPKLTDYIVWFAKNRENMKFHPLFENKSLGKDTPFRYYRSKNGTVASIREGDEPDKSLRPFRLQTLGSSGYTPSCTFDFTFEGKTFSLGGKSWRTTRDGMERLAKIGRIVPSGRYLNFVQYHDDFPMQQIGNVWTDTYTEFGKTYVVQTSKEVIKRCMLLTTDPGDIIFDPTCGSGTTAVVAEQWGRRWITCDTSRVAVTLAKQRLMTSPFDFYDLSNDDVGVDGGFIYRTLSHITLKSVAHNEEPPQETLYDQPVINRDKVRVTGPFTVEAVPAPIVAEINQKQQAIAPFVNLSVGRSGPTQRHADWRSELLKGGVRGLGGAKIKFSRVEPLSGTRYLHAEAETVEDNARRVVISFGPDYQPLEQRQVELAWDEARTLDPRPDIVLFAAFQFDPEAAKDIDEIPAAVTKKTTFLKAQMNTDLLTDDLKKKRSVNQSFWLVGRPDVDVQKISAGSHKGKYRVAVQGFDYYDVKTGQIESGDSGQIAMWMLDTDYDGRSLFPRQVFFPNTVGKGGWNRLAKTLRAELDEDLLNQYLGTESLPFGPGQNRRIAVKIVDNRGIESLRVLDLP
jgi:adenine-specific DNA-methyltransferase